MENNFKDKIKRKRRKKIGAIVLILILAVIAVTQFEFETVKDVAEKAQQKVTGNDTITVTMEIRCDGLSSDLSKLKKQEKAKYVPEDGIIMEKTEFVMEKDSTAFDLLRKATNQKDIQTEYSYTNVYDSYYVEGINHLYEFDAGKLSGWQYYVNEKYPQYGCSQYTLKNKDRILWVYTCDNGKDINIEELQ